MQLVTSPNVQLQSKPVIALNWLCVFLAFHTVAFIAQYIGNETSIHNAIDKVERRISLDSAFLDVGNNTLNTPVNEYAIYRYLDKLNTTLKAQVSPVLVGAIQEITVKDETLSTFPELHQTSFVNAEQEISILLRTKSPLQGLSFSWVALVASLLVAPFFAFASRRAIRKAIAEAEAPPPQPRLIINLQDKTISNGINDKVVTLQNKPLCFYTALVKYCIENPNAPLPPHKDVPHELMALANKSFGRLIELGHTKRKRPDFNANLDKTLSEIRAALDEVFTGFIEEKETYYPPRAQGEGSRSKQHSYALPSIKKEDIEIIGN